MILRRIKAHVEKENWFAVGIDFLIVVGGVFIGLQVANWNEERQADAREHLILTRLLEETTVTANYFDNMIQSFEHSNEARVDSIEALQTQAWRDMDEDFLIYGISTTAVLPTPSVRRSALDELLGSGFYSSLENEDLRTALDNYVASLRFLRGQTDYLRANVKMLTDFDGFTLTIDRDKSRQTGVDVDFELLKTEPGFFETVIDGHNSIMAMTDWWGWAQSDLLELCEAVAAHLGEPCEAKQPSDNEVTP